MKPRTQSIVNEFERRLRDARREVWRTVVRTDEELATLEAHQAGAPIEDAGTSSVAGVLSRLDGAERHLLDEIDVAQARLAAGTFGACERCGTSIPLARLRAVPATRLCVVCARVGGGGETPGRGGGRAEPRRRRPRVGDVYLGGRRLTPWPPNSP